ncbi:MAG: hypothetical protein OEU86_03495 [Gammaproteobacteria bacterium]|nr:hypothetical protein [Gammaproteobacteria bacterium]
MFGYEYIDKMAGHSCEVLPLSEINNDDGGPYLQLTRADDATLPAGFLRLWQGDGQHWIDRMIHFRLQSDPVDTQLFFLFGRSDSAMPHFHAQVVQFAPDACVYNADFLPRLDPVEHPDYFTEVFTPLNKPYWKAISDTANICALAPASPAIATYLSDWSIGTGRPTNKAELERVTPQIDAFLDYCLQLGTNLSYTNIDTEATRERNRKHLDIFFSDKLDPRAWKGVYSVIGEEAGKQIKQIFKTDILD